jgi:hypothetical protein
MPMPQGPMVYCGNIEEHDKHPMPGQGFVRGPDFKNAWCDGVPELKPFVELTIRVPLQSAAFASTSHEAAMRFMERAGLEMFINYMDHPDTSLVMRVRTADRGDRVYPIIRNAEGKGFKAVVMPDGQ